MLSQFVQEAAPGEAAAIARDIEILSGSNHAVSTQLKTALLKHNVQSCRVVKVNNTSTFTSKYNERGSNKFWSRGNEFEVDEQGNVSNIQQGEPLDREGSKLLEQLESYVATHYFDASVDVFPYEGGYALVVKGEKLSPRNFFNGAWTAQYVVNGGIKGEINVDIHYYEDGNVRLKANKEVSTPKSTVEAIAAAENEFQQELTKQLAELNQNEFKLLRRQLPVTRSQMVWSKATAGYKIGAELQQR